MTAMTPAPMLDPRTLLKAAPAFRGPSASSYEAARPFAISGFCLRALAAAALIGVALLSGCSVTQAIPAVAPSVAFHLKGQARGGQQPVSGATIQLYSASTAGNGSSAIAMLTSPVLTDATGSFNITGLYACPSATTQVYLTATGGNPGLPGNVNNAAIALAVALGDCGNLPGTPTVSINEITTVAAAYALAPFARSITEIGSSPTNQLGLRNAMATAMMLADSASGFTPSSQLPANATVEAAKLTTLANLLAVCVNSDGGALCTRLFADIVGPSAILAGTHAPADTFSAMLAIATHPGNQMLALFNDVPALSAFGGSLPRVPHDWTLSIAYSGGGLNLPSAVAIDYAGNPWVVSAAGTLSGFSPQGVPMSANGYTGGSLHESFSLALDRSSNVWIANQQTASTFPANTGSVVQFNANGNLISGPNGFTAGNINQPTAAATDFNGNVWIANYGSSTVTLLDKNGIPLSGASGYGAGVLINPDALAVDTFNNVWIASASSSLLTQIDPQGNILTSVACCARANTLAFDSLGYLWAGSVSASTLTRISGGVVIQNGITGGGLDSPQTISVDGADHLWIANASSGTLSEFGGTGSPEGPGTAISPAGGLGLDVKMAQPYGVGIDPSGSVWVSSFGSNRLIKFVGAAVPVRTPGVGLPRQP